jgi:hypothetical protein
MAPKEAVHQEIEVEQISPPPPAALRSEKLDHTTFAVDLNHAENGHGELAKKIRTRTRTSATDNTAFSRVETLVEGGRTAGVKVSFNSAGLRREDRFITVSLAKNHGERGMWKHLYLYLCFQETSTKFSQVYRSN